MTKISFLLFFIACSIAAHGWAAEVRPERQPLREIQASARLPRAVDVFLEIEESQQDVAAGIRAHVVFVNRGTRPVTLLSAAEHAVLLLSDDSGPREHPAALQQMVPALHLGDTQPQTELAPGAEVRVPLLVETVFSVPPPPAPVEPQKGGELTVVASAYGHRDGRSIVPVSAGTWYVRLQAMLIEDGVPPEKTGRIFASTFVKVVLGGGAE